MATQRLVTNQNMDIIKECADEDAAIDFIMQQSEDANLEIYTREEYERFTAASAPLLEAVLSEGKGEEEIESFEGTLEKCIEWANDILEKRSSGCVEITNPKTGVNVKSVNKMPREMFVVNEDSTIEVMNNIGNDDIVNMIGSDYYPAVFRKSTYGIEYASIDLNEGTLEWIEATKKTQAFNQ